MHPRAILLAFCTGAFLAASAPAQTVSDLFTQGNARYARQDYSGAIAAYDRALQLEPGNAFYYHGRGAARQAAGDLDGAIMDYGRALELDPKFAAACYNRGTARKAKGDLPGAIADYDHALQLDPKYALALTGRGNARKAGGNFAAAIVDYDRALQLDPKYAATWYHRGLAHYLLQQWPGALRDFRRAGELQPQAQEHPRRFVWLVQARSGQATAADRELAAHLEKRPKDSPADWPSGLARFLLGRIDEAALLAALPTSVGEADRRCEYWFYVGMKRLLAGDTSAAECFRKSLTTAGATCVEFQMAQSELKALEK
jgi:tetratricopeptide (TPR) repeat protein